MGNQFEVSKQYEGPILHLFCNKFLEFMLPAYTFHFTKVLGTTKFYQLDGFILDMFHPGASYTSSFQSLIWNENLSDSGIFFSLKFTDFFNEMRQMFLSKPNQAKTYNICCSQYIWEVLNNTLQHHNILSGHMLLARQVEGRKDWHRRDQLVQRHEFS